MAAIITFAEHRDGKLRRASLEAVSEARRLASAAGGRVESVLVGSGADFAALARELSDDTGSRESGGDLGEAERADFVGPFADAVWGMEPGEIRGPVKTEFGWHVIKLDSVSPEIVRSFEDVRAELEPEFRRLQVEKAFGDAQEELDTRAFEAAGDLASVAAAVDRPVQRIERYTRAGSAELGTTAQVAEAVFSPDVLAGRELRVVEIAPGKVVALGVRKHEPARARPLDEVRPQVIEAARLEAAGRLAAERAAEAAKALVGGADWKATVAPWSGVAGSESPRALRRDDPAVPREILEAAFRAQVSAGKPAFGTATLATGDAAVWTVTAVEAGKVDTLDAAARQAAFNDARDRQAMSDATVYITTMRANAEVDVNPQLFE
jgi:peptidyl-prolyl cis-trans isomerase D